MALFFVIATSSRDNFKGYLTIDHTGIYTRPNNAIIKLYKTPKISSNFI